jgi:hypothetical protein
MRALALRALTDQEKATVKKLAASRAAPAVEVRRAQPLIHLAQGASPLSWTGWSSGFPQEMSTCS